MKKKLSVILAVSSVIAVSLAGCNSSSQNSSTDKNTSTESSVTVSSEISPADNSENNNESSTESSTSESKSDDNNSETASEESQESSDSPSLENTEQKSKYLTLSSTQINVSKKKIDLQSYDLSKPGVFTITSVSELNDFYQKNKSSYSLDEVDSGITFSELTKDFDKAFFDENEIIVILQKYDKDNGLEIGDAYIENSELKINVCKTEPSSADKTAYGCSVIGISKNDVGKAKPTVITISPSDYNENEE